MRVNVNVDSYPWKGGSEALEFGTIFSEVAATSGLRSDIGVIAATLAATANGEASITKAEIRKIAVLNRKLLSPY